MSNMADVLSEAEIVYPSQAPGFTPVYLGGVCVAHRSVFYVVFCFVCLHPVSCVPYVATLSELSILDCPFGFL